MAYGLKCLIKEEEGLYYLSSKNKGADRLGSQRTAHPRLCFSLMHKAGFLMTQLSSSLVSKAGLNRMTYQIEGKCKKFYTCMLLSVGLQIHVQHSLQLW